jgi:hypothetical protein
VRRRRSGALRRAAGALLRAGTAELAARAVRTYLAERLDVSGSSLTPSETEPLLLQRRVSPETAEACRTLLAQLDEAMYRPDASKSLAEITAALQRVLPAVDAALDAPPPQPEELP